VATAYLTGNGGNGGKGGINIAWLAVLIVIKFTDRAGRGPLSAESTFA
jgi:hypothetical protein